jgi:hypothetical protein
MRARRSWSTAATGILIFLALLPRSLWASFSTAELTRSAARIFRGRCVAARPETVDFEGRPLAATLYIFEVSEYLKGDGSSRLSFRQAGTPDRGVTDLGRVAGLTVFAPGIEYLVFLRPESRAGLTSAAGRGRGVFLIQDESVRAADLDGRAPAPGAEAIPYDALRRAILKVREESH